MKNFAQILNELKSWNNYDPFVHPLEIILRNVPKQKLIYKDELLKGMQISLDQKDAEELEFLIAICIYDGIDKTFTALFCAFLKQNWHRCHEDIVILFENLVDPGSVDCLYDTALEIPDYDQGRSLTKKCIWALGAINTKESKEKLQRLSTSNDQIIKDTASTQISQPGAGV